MSTKHQHLVQLNGQLYDAVTGVRIGESPTPAKTPKAHSATHRSTRRTAAPKTAVKHPAAPKQAAVVHSVQHAKKAQTKRTQQSKTLMRTSVKSPARIKEEKRIQRQSAAQKTRSEHIFNPSHDITTDPNRVLRSMHIERSGLISRFGPDSQHQQTKQAVVAVAQPPAHVVSKTPAPQRSAATAPQPRPQISAQDPFAVALSKATSHTQPQPKKPNPFQRTARRIGIKPRSLAIGGATLAVLVVAGALARYNAPYVALKMASSEAGIQATLPSYQPAGYSMQPIQADDGQVSVTYHSNSDDRSFKLIQRASNWNSSGLLENVVEGRNHQVYQASGRTVFVYDNNTATWVDGGIWYKIEGNTTLGSDQLLRIVDSM